MNPQADPVSQARVAAPAAIPVAQQVYWSLQRELWESRSLYLAPLAVAVVFLFGYAISIARVARRVGDPAALSPLQRYELLGEPYTFAALVMMGITMLVGAFYSLDALYGERRDRSILFWKSLPVSDAVTVLSKASIPLLLLPLLAVALTFVLHLLMRLLGSAVLLGSGQSAEVLASHAPLLPMTRSMFHHMVFGHVLWFAPFYAWLLLVSAWARRVPALWAILPPVGIGVLEKLVFNTSYFGRILGAPMSGGMDTDAVAGGMANPLIHLEHTGPLSSPGVWLGLGVATTFLFAAIRLRRHRGPN